MKKLLLLALLFLSSLEAATIRTQGANIDANTRVVVSVAEMPAVQGDWVAIFPVGARSTFANIVAYTYTGGVAAGDFDLGLVPAGDYEARAFAAHTWHSLVSYNFSVTGHAVTPTVTTTKDIFNTNEAVTVSISNMPGANHDWVGIFPVGARNTFANIVSYVYTNGIDAGNLNLGLIPAGDYEARVFYANTWRPQASHAFTVEGPNVNPTVTTSQETYISTQTVSVALTNMPGDNHDWVAIFPVGARSTFANIVTYRYTNGITNGTLILGSLPAGNYEVRAFYANSWRMRATHTFTVTQNNAPTIVYEDFESGNLNKWVIAHDGGRENRPPHMEISAGFDGSQHSGYFRGSCAGNQNLYSMVMNTNTHFFLELDQNVVTNLSHGIIGVDVMTTQGARRMSWDPWINHVDGRPAERKVFHFNNQEYVVLVFNHPHGKTRAERAANTRIPTAPVLHTRLDLQAYLEVLEPGNQLLSISTFIYGNCSRIDNIALSRQ